MGARSGRSRLAAIGRCRPPAPSHDNTPGVRCARLLEPPAAEGHLRIPHPDGPQLHRHVPRKEARVSFAVFQSGARFFFGDTHSVQGDGEVSGTALERSLAGVFRLVLYKNTGQEWS